MKVKEVIKFECWVDGMRIWQNTYAENVFEIEESYLPKTADDYDWSWYDLPEDPNYLILVYGGRDIKIIVEFFAGDAMPEHDEPIITFSKWESEIFKEREGI